MNGTVEPIMKDTLKSHNKKFIFFKSVGMRNNWSQALLHTLHTSLIPLLYKQHKYDMAGGNVCTKKIFLSVKFYTLLDFSSLELQRR